MKTIFNIICLLVLFLSTESVAAQEQNTVQKAIIKTSIACDHCRQCPTCGGLLERTLIKTKGIQMITLDQDKKTITVIYNSKKTDLQTIKNAISKLGYDADDVKAQPVAYEKLDGCCKA